MKNLKKKSQKGQISLVFWKKDEKPKEKGAKMANFFSFFLEKMKNLKKKGQRGQISLVFLGKK